MDKGNQNAVAAMSAAMSRMGATVETARAGQAAHVRANPLEAASAGGLHLAAGPESSSLAAAPVSAAARVDLMSRVQQPGPAAVQQPVNPDALAREFQAMQMHQTHGATATGAGPRAIGVTATAGPMPVMGSSGHELQRRQALAAQQQQHHVQMQHLQQQHQMQQQMHMQQMAAQQQQQMQQMQQTQLMLQMQQQQQMQANIAAAQLAQQQAQQQNASEKSSARLFATMRAQQPELDAAAATAPAEASAGQGNMFVPGLHGTALPDLASGNVKWKKSEFVQFLNKLNSGELQLGEDGIKVAGEEAAQAMGGVEASDLAYSSLFGDDEEVDDEEAAMMEKEEAEFIQNLENGGEVTNPWAGQTVDDDANLQRTWLELLEEAKARRYEPPPYEFPASAETDMWRRDPTALDRGIELYDRGELQEALRCFEAAVLQETDNAEAWRWLGQACTQNEKDTQAIAALSKCVQLDPHNLPGLYMLGVAHSNTFDTARSLNCLKQWLLANPEYHGLLDLQALEEYDQLYGDSDDVSSAASGPLNMELHQIVTKLFVDATKVNPKDAEVWTAMGLLYRLTSDFDMSIAAFREALMLRPEDPQMWNKLGAMITNSGQNLDEAIAAYERALQLRPKYVRALANLGISYYNNRQFERAVEAFTNCLSINSEPIHLWSYVRMALSHIGREDLAMLAREQDVDKLRAALYGGAGNA